MEPISLALSPLTDSERSESGDRTEGKAKRRQEGPSGAALAGVPYDEPVQSAAGGTTSSEVQVTESGTRLHVSSVTIQVVGPLATLPPRSPSPPQPPPSPQPVSSGPPTTGYDTRTMPYQDYLQTSEWQATRTQALRRADYRC